MGSPTRRAWTASIGRCGVCSRRISTGISTRVIAWNMLRNRHPVHRSGGVRPRQAERQRAERHEPRLAGEIVKEIIADARNLQQQREEEEKRRVVAEMAAQGYHVDTETGEIADRKQTRTSVTGFCRHSRRRTDRGGSGRLGAWSKERENRLWGSTRRNPKISAWRISRAARGRNNGTETAGGLRRVAFRHGGNGGCRTGKRAAGTVADALRPVRLQRRGGGRQNSVYQEKEQPPGSKAERRPTALIIRPGLLRRNRRAKCRKRRHRA